MGHKAPLRSGWLATGACAAALAVGLGAFAAHGLKQRVAPELLSVFETGARYHMYHALALVALGVASERIGRPWRTLAGWLFSIGIVLFSFSLYLMALTGARWLGAITPLGGTSFIAGWVALAGGALRAPRSDPAARTTP